MSNNSTHYISKAFITKANRPHQQKNTRACTPRSLNPGGVYQAIWCRDARIYSQRLVSIGNIRGELEHIYRYGLIKYNVDREKLVYGRGSPEMKFLSEVASVDKQKEFEGALPTTIYQAGFSEYTDKIRILILQH